MKLLLNYFFRGLLFAFPVFATFYILTVLINWIDETLVSILFGWLPLDVPGIGIVTAVVLLILMGYTITLAISKPLVSFLDRTFAKIPVVKIFYTALKDLAEAFVGDKKRFNEPVIVTLADGLDRVGFITAHDCAELGVENRVPVYCPHSYNFSGNLYLVPPDNVRPLDVDPSDVMKFAVSAGVTGFEHKINPLNKTKETPPTP
ncbi:MAG: DUF502 domain-containing protein [Balneolaceae bacterium]